MDGIVEEVRTETAHSDLLTDREASAYLRLSPRWGYISVQKWARSGVLRGGKVGDHWRFRKEDLDDFVFSKK